MRQLTLLLILIATITISCENDKSFNIYGTVPDTDSGTVRLLQFGESFQDSKTCKIRDNHFQFEGILYDPEEFNIAYEKDDPSGSFKTFRFFVDPGSNIKITLYPDSIMSSKIRGGKSDKEFRNVQSVLDEKYLLNIAALEKEYERFSNDSFKQDSILKITEIIKTDIQNWKLDFISSNPGSIISAYFLYELRPYLSDKTIKDHFNNLDEKLSNSKYYKSIETYLSVLPGNRFTDFELPDSSGNTRRFSELAENKVTLLDFWASWCKPCRAQNKYLVKIYSQFKDQGFEIIGVSSDSDPSLFRKAIVTDDMIWINLIDRTDVGAVNQIYRSYNIPSNLLIDKRGIIIARDVPIENLWNAIDSLLKI